MASSTDMDSGLRPRADVHACSAENRFVELFQEAVGFVGAQWLQFEVPFRDIDGREGYIDFALESPLGRYAFEID
jgi:hypothetical protein